MHLLDPAPGRLLVATPELVDPNFTHTVVYLLAVQDAGALGVVINRPSDTTVGEVMPQFSDAAVAPRVMFLGGPVGLDSVIGLGSMGTVDLAGDDDVEEASIRLFAGSAGWGPGQLDDEIDSGSWWVFESGPDDLLTEHPSRLWSEVLRRQGGVTAWFALATASPQFN